MKRILWPICLLAACSDVTPVPPVSLDGPTAIAVARGRVCLDIRAVGDMRVPIFSECAPGRRAAIGLVVNEQSDRLTFVALDRNSPELVDLQQGIPGVSHLTVGRLPVDVAASSDGTVAYTLNQIDSDISVVNLWKPEVDAQRIQVSGTPIALEARPGSNEILIASGSPSTLWLRPGATCEVSGCDVATDSGQGLTLPGTVTDFAVAPSGEKAFVAFRDLDSIAIIDLQTMSISATVGGAASCSDGVDNDGDGRIDAQDPQCFGPFGAEAAGFAGRTTGATCQDAMDNDEDGLADRDDPNCLTADGDEIDGAIGDVPISDCNDGLDNDNDGNTDFPDDPNCYGSLGATEVAVEPDGFDAVDIDELGKFLYAVDRAHNQVVVFDAERGVVIDAAKSASPRTDAFTNTIGIAVAPTPLDVAATVRRDCMSEDNVALPCTASFFDGNGPDTAYPYDRVVIRYAYGAWVAEDTGRLRYVETMDAFCGLPVNEAREILDADFVEPAALDSTSEHLCTYVPKFPLVARPDYAQSCDVPCDDCDESLLETRFYCNENVGLLVNPKFSLVDVQVSQGNTAGKSQCEIPSLVEAELRNLGNLPNAPRNFRCTSQLLPQPISVAAAALNPDDFPPLDAYQRADLIRTDQSYFGWTGSTLSILNFERIADERLIPESWNVVYDGTLPATRRSDGLLASEATDNAVVFDAAPLDLCAAGVHEGDYLTLLETPEGDADCAQFQGDIGFLTFEIASMDAARMTLIPTGRAEFADEVPTRNCFPRGLNYLVRANGEWVVTGERSGLVSERKNVFGSCVEILSEPGQPTRRSRVKTGETFEGPYFSFYLWPGPHERDPQTGHVIVDSLAIVPTEGLSFTFSVIPNFVSRSFSTEGVFPARILSYQRGSFYRVLSTDANSNFLFYKDGRSSSEFGTRLR